MRFPRKMPALALLIATALGTIPGMALAGQVALVVGNSAYEHTTALANPRNDAEAMAAKLRMMGFTVIEGFDLDKMEMGQLVQEFVRSARDAELSLFFYAGHGMAVDGQNYLIPVDAALEDISAIDFEAMPLELITKQLGYSDGANLIILDACSDNPMAKKLAAASGTVTRSIGGGGLASVKASSSGVGMGIALATEPGDVAQDGTGGHSPFSESLLEHIATPNVPFTSIMSRVVGEVWEATGQQQRPWFNQSFTDDVVLYRVAVPAAVVDAAQVAPADPTAAPAYSEEEERYAFELAREGGTIADYEVFLSLYANGRYAGFARTALERLRGAGEEQVAALPVEAAPATRSVPAYDPNTPLILAVTPAVQAAPANEFTEQALLMDRPKRAEVQARVSATGNDVGGTDGAFGGNTRRGIAGWQATNGLPPTGYLNALQLALLTNQTESSYLAFLQQPVAKPTAPKASKPARTSSASGGTRKPAGSAAPAANPMGSFLEGLGQGIGQELLRRR